MDQRERREHYQQSASIGAPMPSFREEYEEQRKMMAEKLTGRSIDAGKEDGKKPRKAEKVSKALMRRREAKTEQRCEDGE